MMNQFKTNCWLFRLLIWLFGLSHLIKTKHEQYATFRQNDQERFAKIINGKHYLSECWVYTPPWPQYVPCCGHIITLSLYHFVHFHLHFRLFKMGPSRVTVQVHLDSVASARFRHSSFGSAQTQCSPISQLARSYTSPLPGLISYRCPVQVTELFPTSHTHFGLSFHWHRCIHIVWQSHIHTFALESRC